MRTCSRLLGKATATPVKANGLQNIPTDGRPYVLVVNHSSYLDSYVLVSVLPGPVRFVAKGELAKAFYIRAPLKNIHAEFVERFEIEKSVSVTQHLSDVLQAGYPLLFFVEGTFSRIPGLRPFHLGAFSVAAQAGIPVIPIAIRGTRSMLRSESWFPHRGSISMEVGSTINPAEITKEPDQDTWHVAIGLRDRSRDFILRHCGEPDLERQKV